MVMGPVFQILLSVIKEILDGRAMENLEQGIHVVEVDCSKISTGLRRELGAR
jgi:hypothetical protein